MTATSGFVKDIPVTIPRSRQVSKVTCFRNLLSPYIFRLIIIIKILLLYFFLGNHAQVNTTIIQTVYVLM